MKRKLLILASRGSENFVTEIIKNFNNDPECAEEITQVACLIEDFYNGEIGVEILNSVKGSEVFVVKNFKTGNINNDIIEVLLIGDALKRAGALEINLILGHYVYARQERREKNKKNRHKRRPISARVMANLYSLYYNGIIVFDLHSEPIEGFFDGVKIDNVIPVKIFTDYLYETGDLKRKYNSEDEMPVLVAPDSGSFKKVADYAEDLKLNYAIVNKIRINGSEIKSESLVGNVKGKKCIIIDDITVTGGTIINAKKILIENGATEVLAIISHFEAKDEQAIRKIAEAGFTKFLITNSVIYPDLLKDFSVFKILSLEMITAKIIRNINKGQSLQEIVYKKN